MRSRPPLRVALLLVIALVVATSACRSRSHQAEPRDDAGTALAATASAKPLPDASPPPAKGTATTAPPCTQRPADESIARSSDGKSIAFIEVDPTRTESTATDDVPHSRICLVKEGSAPRVVLESHDAPPEAGPEDILAGFAHLVLSPDASTAYFTTATWVTSPAAHAVDTTTGKHRLLFDGTVLQVLSRGPFAGKLLASHFRLDTVHPIESPKYRGRMETFTIAGLDGKTLATLPDDEAARAKWMARH